LTRLMSLADAETFKPRRRNADTTTMIWLMIGAVAVAVAVASWVVLMTGAAADELLERDERDISAGRQPGR
jgi:hypothetical protein